MDYDGEERRKDAFTQCDKRNLEDRILRVEWTQGLHSEAIERLDKTANSIVNDLDGIKTILTQIKYFAMGAVALYMADSFGITTILKLFLGG